LLQEQTQPAFNIVLAAIVDWRAFFAGLQMSWTSSLSQPLTLTDGRRLATLDDVAELVFTLEDARLHKAVWDEAIDLLIDAAMRHPSSLPQAEAKIASAFRVEGLI
jgi:hypothetical protein